MKIMPLTIINIFAVMEIIGLFRHYEVLQKTEVIQYFWIATPTSRLAMTGTVYFLAMIMAKKLFLVFGIILISAFYLIEKF